MLEGLRRSLEWWLRWLLIKLYWVLSRALVWRCVANATAERLRMTLRDPGRLGSPAHSRALAGTCSDGAWLLARASPAAGLTASGRRQRASSHTPRALYIRHPTVTQHCRPHPPNDIAIHAHNCPCMWYFIMYPNQTYQFRWKYSFYNNVSGDRCSVPLKAVTIFTDNYQATTPLLALCIHFTEK